MSFLLDTNVLSELRKPHANAHVLAWFEQTPDDSLFLSVLVVGELRQGIARKRRRDPTGAAHLARWLDKLVERYASRILAVDLRVAELRADLGDPLPLFDGLLAATALVHELTLVTRNVDDVARSGVALFNPFEAA
jgi:predicted nucleic acid-binding protein